MYWTCYSCPCSSPCRNRHSQSCSCTGWSTLGYCYIVSTHYWCRCWCSIFSPTGESRRSTNTPPHAELSIAGVPLSFVTEAKILGVWLQNDLQWDKNIDEIDRQESQSKIVHSPAAQEVWIQWWWALVCLQMLCQTRCWICWCCLVFLYHCATEENFGTPAKTRVQNHLRTSLHYLCGCFGDLWAWVSCWEEGRSLSWVCRRAREFWKYK